MKDNYLTITTETGEEILCEILFTHHSEEFNKDYVVFVDTKTNTASAAVYVPSDNAENGVLEQVETEEEWAMFEELLEDYANENELPESCGGGSCEGCSSCEDEECDCEGDCNCSNE